MMNVHFKISQAAQKRLIRIASLLPTGALLLCRPMELPWEQCVTLGIFIAVVIWWATGAVKQVTASLFLLVEFLLFSGAPAKVVFSFPLSENFILIAVSFLFSQGIANSRLSPKLLGGSLTRWASTPLRLLLTMIACSFAVALFVPQSISRTFIVTALFSDYLDVCRTPVRTRSVLMLGLFSTGFLVGQLFPRGDIVLNYSLLTISGLQLTDWQWICCLALPTLVVLAAVSAVYLVVFRRELAAYRPADTAPAAEPLTRQDAGGLALIVVTCVLWSTETLHGISGTWILCIGTLLMFPLGLLGRRDVKNFDGSVLVYLTAAFSIGKVVAATDLSHRLFGGIGRLLPDVFSWRYALVLMLAAMGIHMLLGSNVSALAAGLPILTAAAGGAAPPLVICLLIYLAVGQQFLLPYHHITLAAGVGRGELSSRDVLRLGAAVTPVILAGGVLVYLGWWRLLGLL